MQAEAYVIFLLASGAFSLPWVGATNVPVPFSSGAFLFVRVKYFEEPALESSLANDGVTGNTGAAIRISVPRIQL